MKKLLAILVLGLLLSSNAYAASVFDYLNTGMTKKQVKKLIHGPKGNYAKSQEFRGLGWSVAPAMCFKGMNSLNKYFSKYNTEITTHYSYFEHNYVPWYVFENVTKPIHMKTGFCKPGTGTLKAVVFSKEEAYAAADPVYAKKYEEEEKRRIAEEKRIAEKPKEKKITSSSQDFNYLEILLNNEVVLDVDREKYRLQFMQDGRLLEDYDGDSWQIISMS